MIKKFQIILLKGPVFFGLFTLLGVFTITYINNTFFYKNKNKEVLRNIDRQVKLYKSVYKSCLKTSTAKFCQRYLDSYIDNSFNYGKIIVEDYKGQTLFNRNREWYKEQREVVNYKGSVGDGKSKIIIKINKKSSPNILKSVIRSLTFSIFDYGKVYKRKLKLWDFIKDVAFPRSSVPLFSAVFFVLLYFVIRKRDLILFDISNKWETEQLQVTTKLEELKLEREELKVKVKELERAHHKASVTKEPDSNIFKLKKMIDDKEIKITELESESQMHEELAELALKELQEKERELRQVELKLVEKEQLEEKISTDLENLSEPGGNVLSFNKGVKSKFLLNPALKKEAYEIDVKPRGHGTQGSIIKMCDSICNDEYSRFLVKQIMSCAYDSNKCGQLILDLEPQHGWVMKAYSKKDKGEGILLILKAESFSEAILTAKYYTFYAQTFLKKQKFKLVVKKSLDQALKAA
jgi:hypothetical protein